MKFRHRELVEPIELGIQMASSTVYGSAAQIVVMYPTGESFSLPVDVARLIYEPADWKAEAFLEAATAVPVREIPTQIPRSAQDFADEFKDGIDGLQISPPDADGVVTFRKPRPRTPAPVHAIRRKDDT